MKDDQTDTAAYELVPTPQEAHQRERAISELSQADTRMSGGLPFDENEAGHLNESEGKDEDEEVAPPPKRRFPAWLLLRDYKELTFLVFVLLTIIPIALLANYAPTLSAALGKEACLPNGNFIFPGQASIWNPDYFFTISITVGSRSRWTYEHVKLIDIFWDVVVGRGGQLLLIYIAWHVFGKSLTYVMEIRPVSFKTYGAVAFRSGSFSSIWPFICALFHTGGPYHTSREWRIFSAFILATLYIAVMPTLFSAMTGYAAVSAPSVEIPPQDNGEGSRNCDSFGGCQVFPCGGPGASTFIETRGGLQRGWGQCLDSMRLDYGQPYTIAEDSDDPVRNYYNKYKQNYVDAANIPACYNSTDSINLSECPPLAIPSGFDEGGATLELDAPLLNIQVFGDNETSGLPNVWLCDGLVLPTIKFANYEYASGSPNITAFCQAGNVYQWGFSYLLLFFVCILNFIFAVIMYALWIEARHESVTTTRMVRGAVASGGREWEKADYPTIMSHATNMVKQAEDAYGDQVRSWTAKKLDEVVWEGEKGMRAPER